MTLIKKQLQKLLLIGVILLVPFSIYSESYIELVHKQYTNLFEQIKFFDLAVHNVGSAEEKEEFQLIKDKFLKGFNQYLASVAPVPHYLRGGYSGAFLTLYGVQEDLVKLAEKFASSYLERAKKIIFEVNKKLYDLNLNYHSDAYITKLITRDINPEKETQLSYNPKVVHRIQDRQQILSILKLSFQNLKYADIARIGGIKENDKYLQEELERPIQYELISTKLVYFQKSINLARKAKLSAFESLKIYNKNLLYCSSIKYADNPYFVEKNIVPVFDARIPNEYKADANDVLLLDHQEEMNIKINQKYLRENQKITPKECSYTYSEETK